MTPDISSPLMIGVFGPELTADDRERLRRIRPASVILFRHNFRSADQMKELLAAIREEAGPQVMRAIDHEGGRVVRFPEALPEFPAPREMAKARDPKVVRGYAETAAHALKDWGFDLNLAPVVDVLTPTSHPRMHSRCFGDDPALVAEMAQAFIEGMRAGGIKTCAKHFPGVGAAELDPHETRPTVTIPLEIQKRHIEPFRRMATFGVDAIMTSHITYTCLDPDSPCTLSKKIVDLIRNDFKFKGLILSDDLEMGSIMERHTIEDAVARAKDAGCDILLVCKDPQLQDRAFNQLG